MKKLLFLMAFVLFSLCSYSQNLTIHNDSAYDINVTATSSLPSSCDDNQYSTSVAAGTTGSINIVSGDEWMTVRAIVDGLPGYSVAAESQCSSSCGLNVSNGLTLVWNTACAEVTIDD